MRNIITVNIPFGDKKVTQFSGFLRTSVSYLMGAGRSADLKISTGKIEENVILGHICMVCV